VVAGLDRHEDGDAEPELILVDQCDPALNDPVGLQPLDTLPTRGRDSPTKLPISATEREASSCRSVRILRSMASISPILEGK
jgi:hypothetical protein